MKRRTKLAILIGLCAIALGAMLALGVMLGIGFDWKRLDTSPTYETVCLELLDPFVSIEVTQTDADIKIVYTNAKYPMVQYMQSEDIRYSAHTEDGVLRVQEEGTRPLLSYIGFHFIKSDEVATILYLPAKEYEYLHLNTVSGDVTVSNGGAVTVGETTYAGPISFSEVNIKTTSGDIVFDGELRAAAPMTLMSSSGNIIVKHVTAGSVSAHSVSGDVALLDCALEAFAAKTTSGDVEVRSVQSVQGSMETTSGDVVCNQLSAEMLTFQSTSGEVKLERTTATVSLRAVTTSGDVETVSCYATEFRIESNSGDVALYFDDGINIIETETVSGDVQLEPKNQDNRGYGDCYVKTTSGDIYISRPPLSLWFN